MRSFGGIIAFNLIFFRDLSRIGTAVKLEDKPAIGRTVTSRKIDFIKMPSCGKLHEKKSRSGADFSDLCNKSPADTVFIVEKKPKNGKK